MSRIAVFGATGLTGGLVVKHALDQGHQVVALVRDPGRMTFKHPNLLVMNGSPTSLADVERCVQGTDAIGIAKTPDALNLPGFDFHGLQGKPKRYSVHVNGPWCITFEWQGENAFKLDLENYH
jgi:proteic killer suppression protein